jgi:xanthine dehydrogenase accessory factor
MTIWHEIEKLLEQGCSLYMLTVVESNGSAPGRRGFKMIVSDRGLLLGSIGGGIMEFNMVEKAKALLQDKVIQQHCIQQDHWGQSQSSSGMICSGSQSIAFTHLSCDDLMWVQACKKSHVMIELTGKSIKLIGIDKAEYFTQKFIDVWSYTELINVNYTIHVFGAGHVSLPTTELLEKIGFDVCLYDNRTDINTFDANKIATHKAVIDYSKIAEEINISPQDYVLIMTHKFTEDKLILSQLLNKKLAYIGVLGSSNKINIMFDSLLKNGFDQEQLNKVSAPIGLDISSQTTDEIAISIAAEIIKIKRKK